MKKCFVFIMVAAMYVCAFTACDKGDGGNSTKVTVSEESKESKESETAAESQTAETVVDSQTSSTSTSISEEKLRALMDENINVNLNIFGVRSLPFEEEEVNDETTIYQVKQDVFPDYASFENYIRSIYCEETADMYLYNYPVEGAQKYVNQDGKLCVDLQFEGGNGYYVDWSDYTIEIVSATETECEFIVKASVEWPAEEPVKEDYEVTGKAILENGAWVLTEMIV